MQPRRGARRNKQFLRVLNFDFLWLLDVKVIFEGKLFDWGQLHLVAPSGGLIGLGPDGDNLVAVR